MAQEQTAQSPIRIDIGCGSAKREGFIGLDYVAAPGVDHVMDLMKERLPFEDGTVDHVFSSHFLEHIKIPFPLLTEIARVCKDGAKIEFWTPYGFTNEAFLYGHETVLTEEIWIHFCYAFRDTWERVLRGRWQFLNINYVVTKEIEKDLISNGFSVDFAIRYFKAVVLEFGVEFEFRRDMNVPAVLPQRTYSHTRYGERFPLITEIKKVPQPRKVLTLIPAGLTRIARKLLYK